jgi:hypothetical protein
MFSKFITNIDSSVAVNIKHIVEMRQYADGTTTVWTSSSSQDNTVTFVCTVKELLEKIWALNNTDKTTICVEK